MLLAPMVLTDRAAPGAALQSGRKSHASQGYSIGADGRFTLVAAGASTHASGMANVGMLVECIPFTCLTPRVCGALLLLQLRLRRYEPHGTTSHHPAADFGPVWACLLLHCFGAYAVGVCGVHQVAAPDAAGSAQPSAPGARPYEHQARLAPLRSPVLPVLTRTTVWCVAHALCSVGSGRPRRDQAAQSYGCRKRPRRRHHSNT